MRRMPAAIALSPTMRKKPISPVAAHVRAAAEFHGVTVQLVGVAADLHHADDVAVFVAEELHDVGPLFASA